MALSSAVNVVAVVQARTTSSRFPRKVLRDLAGVPMLVHVVRRAAAAANVNEVVVATTANPADDPIVSIAEREGARWFRGGEADVLGRFVSAARAARADVVVRLTADCPLLDPGVIDAVTAPLLRDPDRYDYSSNVLRRTFPRGLDAEALHADVLERLGRMARSADAREHVTWFVRDERPSLFATFSLVDEVDNSDLRWTVDLPSDLDVVRHLYEALDLGSQLRPYGQVVEHVRLAADDGG